MSNAKKPKFITPPNHLKAKTGSGGIPKTRIDAAQNNIDTYEIDFAPIAKSLTQNLSEAIKAANDNIAHKKPTNKSALIIPIMQIKANGGMFCYQLLSDVADICLQFLEALDDYNKEALDIVKAHENVILIIIKNNLHGDGGSEGYALVQELHKATKRYFKKFNI